MVTLILAMGVLIKIEQIEGVGAVEEISILTRVVSNHAVTIGIKIPTRIEAVARR